MSDAQHTPPQDPSFRRSVLRNLAGAVGLVVLVAGIFGVLGMIGRADVDDPDLAIDDVPDEEEPAEDDDEADDDDDGLEAPEDEIDPTDDPADDGAADDPDEGDVDDGNGAEDDAEQPDEAPSEEEPDQAPDPPAAIDPGEISVQVLDGFRADGGAAADAVSEQLRAAGYDIVARNPAIAYEVTTVLWTEGFEAEARQVAVEIDAAEVREQPGNLSTAVNVHVVIGADRG